MTKTNTELVKEVKQIIKLVDKNLKPFERKFVVIFNYNDTYDLYLKSFYYKSNRNVITRKTFIKTFSNFYDVQIAMNELIENCL